MRVLENNSLVAEIIVKLRSIIYAPEGSITSRTMLADLGLDSLDLMEAGLELEAAIGHDMPDNALFEVKTVGDLAACLAGRATPTLALAA